MDMSLDQLIPLITKASIVLMVFSLGLHADLREAVFLFRRPELLVRSLLSMNVVMPVFAVAMAAVFELHPAVEVTFIALALSPVPPLLPKKQTEAGGEEPYAIGLLVAAALFAVVAVPSGVSLVGKLFAKEMHVTWSAVAMLVLTTILLPLGVGLLARRLAPAIADRVARPLSIVSTAILVAAALPILFAAWPLLRGLVGGGTLLALVLFSLVGLIAGHLLGGPKHYDQTVLSLATAARHPGIALAIAGQNFPDQKAVLGVVVWHLIVSGLIAIPYVQWRRRDALMKIRR